MREVGVLAGGVEHHQQVIARAGDHQIVEDAAVIVGELRVTLLARLQARDVARHQRLDCLGRVLPGLGRQPHLAHVRDVEQAGRRPRLRVLGQDAGRVLHRHLVAGEGHEARAELAMQVVERCAFEGIAQEGLQESRGPTQGLRRLRPPLSGDLKDSPLPAYFVGGRAPVRKPVTFQRPILLRSFCLRVSGAGCSFGAAVEQRSLPQGSSGWRDLRRPPRRRPPGKPVTNPELRRHLKLSDYSLIK